MKVRCNNCMEEFEEEEIIMVPDKDFPSCAVEEGCPFCKKAGCLMDLEEEND